jgi:hypothetical protein
MLEETGADVTSACHSKHLHSRHAVQLVSRLTYAGFCTVGLQKAGTKCNIATCSVAGSRVAAGYPVVC